MARIAFRGRAAATVAATLVLGVTGAAQAGAVQADESRSTTATQARAAATEVDYDTWLGDVRKVMDEARPYVEQRLDNSAGEKPAIVLDIDNTSLETHFQALPPTPAVKPTLEIAQYAHSKGAAIFFVTARPDLISWVTEANLEAVGYPITGLYQRNIGDLFRDTAEFKTSKRAQIEADGYTIVANIGNNTSDLVGGHAERTFKLPDYDGALN
ncbi:MULTISPECIES: HAD family acid phosphatase [Streptomyces]|uniref:Hydrolase n=1 Tax=Streptomyces olivaceus TaxID=47716 RepID=A0ABS7WG03_STROV|nr:MULTISPECIES: HAD family acid phosphatase [Streptomyces]MBZ6093615.1 hydrolase [Streptomyces olivaceus]MBZ6100718.1 hydrolase [Streptomyces olivaceus]MBZ6113491.1 hydrolase [Streptomyces olivaceus]MBZ6121816.1 hydrolase [Streptomyces olivaceus]MBZ6127264.1 hydrolase [Streptomyces olivaceus]